ncbi:hypothetical protein ACYZT8_23905 [Pseudomonas sp. LB3P93]
MLTNTFLFGFDESGSNTASISITAACTGSANMVQIRLANTQRRPAENDCLREKFIIVPSKP